MLPGMCGIMPSAAGGNVTLNAATIEVAGSGSRSTAFRLSNDGFVYHGIDAVYTSQYRWTADPVANYDARVTLTAGTSPTGSTVGSWLNMATTRTWTNTDAVSNGVEVFAVLTVEIRDAVSLAVVASCVTRLVAERTS